MFFSGTIDAAERFFGEPKTVLLWKPLFEPLFLSLRSSFFLHTGVFFC